MDLRSFNPADLERWLAEAPAAWAPIPAAEDRAAWSGIAGALGDEGTRLAVAAGERAAGEPLPPLPATLWLEFERTGQREGYQEARGRHRAVLRDLIVAECLEGAGRFLGPILDGAWAVCEESSWCLPAHQATLADVERPVIDLGAAMTALEMAELDHVLGDRLRPELRTRIRREVDRRLFEPYLARHDFWWMYNTERRAVNNWTAVCTAGVAGAACYLEPDAGRLADVLHKAARSLHDYLATFDREGGTTEGPGYWSYGFGYFVLLAQLVEARTGGQAHWMDAPIVREAAQFPLRTALSPGRYVNFSDAAEVARLTPSQLVYLARRLDLPALEALATVQGGSGRSELAWALRSLVWRPAPDAAQPVTPARHDWFGGMHWMIARADPADPDALVVAAKGGHNREMHNQNDVGNVIVHLGGESLVADLGAGRYTKAYFGPQRYEHLANASAGHSVPLPNGQAQAPGLAFAAELLEHRAGEREDTLALELKGAYPPEADLERLRRRVTLHREAAPRESWVELEDGVRFATRPGTLESVLITFGAAHEAGPGWVVLRGERAALRVGYDPAVVVPRIEVVPDVDLSGGRRDVTRVRFALIRPADEATIRLQLRPALAPAG